MKKKMIAALVATAMAIGMCSIGAFAEDTKENVDGIVTGEVETVNTSNAGTGEEDIPDGITYDKETNTLILKNLTPELEEKSEVSWRQSIDDEDLTVKVIGRNIIKGSSNHEGFDFDDYDLETVFFMWGTGALTIEGTGAESSSIEMTGIDLFINQLSSADWDEDTEEYVSGAGDIYIKDVSISLDGEGIMSQYSNVTIENSAIDINCKTDSFRGYYGYTFGLCTGRTETNQRYEGTLTVTGSEIEIKNCDRPLAYNELILNNCYLYGGIDSAVYKIDPDRVNYYVNYGTVKRYYYPDSYMKISKSDLGLGEAYYLEDDTDYEEKGYIVLPDLAAAGQKIEVKVVPDEGYCLKQLYVNDEPIQGTSFTMPAQDTLVKATFEKVKSTNADVKVNNIQLSGISKKIAAGKKIKLTATVSPSNASNQNLTWKSSNTKVATVDASGMVTMKKKSGGKSVTITAAAADGSGVSAAYKIKSMKGVVKKVSISGKKTVKAGKSLKLKGKVKSTKKANTKLLWSSSNTDYATVNKSGKISAKAAGKGKKVKITAMATDGSNKKKTVTIKIK